MENIAFNFILRFLRHLKDISKQKSDDAMLSKLKDTPIFIDTLNFLSDFLNDFIIH